MSSRKYALGFISPIARPSNTQSSFILVFPVVQFLPSQRRPVSPKLQDDMSVTWWCHHYYFFWLLFWTPLDGTDSSSDAGTVCCLYVSSQHTGFGVITVLHSVRKALRSPSFGVLLNLDAVLLFSVHIKWCTFACFSIFAAHACIFWEVLLYHRFPSFSPSIFLCSSLHMTNRSIFPQAPNESTLLASTQKKRKQTVWRPEGGISRIPVSWRLDDQFRPRPIIWPHH